MVGIKRFKLLIGIFMPFLAILLMSQNTFAAQFNSWLNIQDISKTNLSNDWITHNNSNAGSYSVSGSTRLQTYRLSGSANLSSAISGPYFNASGSIYIEVPNDLEGGVVCSAFTNGSIVPENVSVNVSSTSVTNCSYESAPYVNKYTININTNGSISSGSPTTFYFNLVSNPNNPFISLVGSPGNSPRVFISGDINFSSSSSPEFNSLTEINQNIVIISSELQNMQQQMSQNTESIINNQNQNTEAIIKSNQRCAASKNLFSGWVIGTGLNSSNGSEFSWAAAATSDYIPIDFNVNSNYYLSDLSTGLFNYVAAYNSEHVFLGRTSASSSSSMLLRSGIFIGGTPQGTGDVAYVRVTTYPAGVANAPISSINNLKTQLEVGSSASSYEPYGEEVCKNINEEYYDEQRQADENISNQSTSDIEAAENQTTTNLIGVLSGFISAFSNINATNCNLTLEFPDYAGGTRIVNICSGKEKAPRIVEIGSSLLLIGIFVPLAYILIKMIYNEIRSWTNG